MLHYGIVIKLTSTRSRLSRVLRCSRFPQSFRTMKSHRGTGFLLQGRVCSFQNGLLCFQCLTHRRYTRKLNNKTLASLKIQKREMDSQEVAFFSFGAILTSPIQPCALERTELCCACAKIHHRALFTACA